MTDGKQRTQSSFLARLSILTLIALATASCGKKVEEKFNEANSEPTTFEEREPSPSKDGAVKPIMNAEPACDQACRQHCDGQAEPQLCIRAFNAGCFSGTAPATFDCGTYKPSAAEKSTGVELQTTPNVDY